MRVALDGTLPPAHRVDGVYTELGWNGETQYSEVPVLQHPYVRKCLLCGRHPEIEWLDDNQVRVLGLRGIGACEVCGGFRFLDLQEVGGISSPQRAAPATPEVEAAAWPVPRRSHHAA